MAKEATKYLDTDPWKIIETGFHKEHSMVSESIFSLGNEYCGVRGYFEEAYGGEKLTGNYFNGIWSEIPIQYAVHYKGLASTWRFMVNALDWLYTRIILDGEVLDLYQARISNFRRELNMKEGSYTRSFRWHSLSGKDIDLCLTRFVSMHRPNIGVQRISMTPVNFSGTVTVKMGLDFSPPHVSMDGQNFWDLLKMEQTDFGLAIHGKLAKSRQQLFSCSRVVSDQIESATLFKEEKLIGEKYSISLSEGKSAVLDKLVYNHAHKLRHSGERAVWETAMEAGGRITTLSFEELLEEQKSYWSAVWEKNDIEIEGDYENQQGIRYCIFQLLQTNHGQDPGNNIGAKGLTGEMYSGHTFWDTESYCLPFYIFNQPEAAKNLLLFRYKTLQAAMDWSKEQNCQGAFYPMSTIDGTESCPVWWHGNLEIHVSAAVAYGIWHYHNICQDAGFLYREGIEMLLEISRFFASRGDWRDDGYGYYGVMGPDEFHTFVNNNYYTNLMAKKSLEFTLEVIGEMKQKAGERLIAVFSKCNISGEEISDWENKARNMILPVDKKSGLPEQHEGYFRLPHIDIDAIPVEEFPLYHSWTLPRIYRYDMIKQPDTLLCMLFYSQEYTEEEKRLSYEYYEPRCIHESSLSPSVHSILAAELGKKKEAYDFFKFATRLDLDNYNRNTHEGLHLTSISAAWMNIVYGFGGLRSDGDLLLLNPQIPENWKSFRFKISYRGVIITVEVSPKQVSLYCNEGRIPVLLWGEEKEITPVIRNHAFPS